jgi:hypothetical protein
MSILEKLFAESFPPEGFSFNYFPSLNRAKYGLLARSRRKLVSDTLIIVASGYNKFRLKEINHRIHDSIKPSLRVPESMRGSWQVD